MPNDEQPVQTPLSRKQRLGLALAFVSLIPIWFIFLKTDEPQGDELNIEPTTTTAASVSYENLSETATIINATISLTEASWEDDISNYFGFEDAYDIKDPELRDELTALALRYINYDRTEPPSEEFDYLTEELLETAASTTEPYLSIDALAGVPGVNWDKSETISLPCIETHFHAESFEEETVTTASEEELCEFVDWRETDFFQVYVLSERITSHSVYQFKGTVVNIERIDGEFKVVL